MDQHTKQYAVFIGDRYSPCGVGFQIIPMSETEYDREVAANYKLRDMGQKIPSVSFLRATEEQAWSEVRDYFDRETWAKLF